MAVLIGHITVVQEERFRIVTEDGRGFLLTLGRDADVTDAELKQFQRNQIRMRIEYDGKPNTASGLAQKIQPLDGGGEHQR
jgi:hypothetical protein